MQDSSWQSLFLQPSVVQLEQIFEFSTHLVFIYNWDLKKLIFVNNRVTEKLGYSLQDMQEMGESLNMLIEHPNKEEFLKDIFHRYEALKVGENVEFLSEIYHKNGGIRTFRNRSMVLVRDTPESSRLIMNVAE